LVSEANVLRYPIAVGVPVKNHTCQYAIHHKPDAVGPAEACSESWDAAEEEGADTAATADLRSVGMLYNSQEEHGSGSVETIRICSAEDFEIPAMGKDGDLFLASDSLGVLGGYKNLCEMIVLHNASPTHISPG
jgi:hypothetical protein